MFQKPTYEELFEENQILKAIIKSLSERISELEVILKQNSQTSFKPPSSDGYKKAARVKGLRKTIKEVALNFPMSRTLWWSIYPYSARAANIRISEPLKKVPAVQDT